MNKGKRVTLCVLLVVLALATCCFAAACGKTETVKYSVTFDTDGGTAVPAIEVEKDKQAEKPQDPTKIGYGFAGWFVGDTEFSFEQKITEDLTLKAKWTANTDTAYTVKHFKESLDGSFEEVTADTELLTGTTGALTAAVAKAYSGFTAEEIAQVTIAADGSAVVEVKYDRNSYTVTWIIDGESFSEEYKFGTTPTHADPEKTSDATYTYTFAGWDKEIVTVTENATYTATFDSAYINYAVTFKAEDGTVISTKEDYHYGDTIEVPAAQEKAENETYTYTFNGWHNPETVVGNFEETAAFTPVYKNYTVTFKAEDGTVITTKEDYHFGDTIEVPAAQEKAEDDTYTYTFNGWHNPDTVLGNYEETATFTPVYKNYTVTFKAEDGTVLMTKADYHYGDTIEVPAAQEKAEDDTYTYTFNGWHNPATVEGNFEETAAFTPVYKNYTVTFKAEDGTVITTKEDYHFGDTIEVPTAQEKAENETYTYTFNGWHNPATVNGNYEETATFTPVYKNYTVTFKAEDGTVISTKADYHYGDKIVLPETDPKKDSTETYTYTFNGWHNPKFVEGNYEETATFTENYIEYTVKFIAFDGKTEISSENYHYGDAVEVPDHTESLAGYTYGWDKEIEETVSAEATYTETKTANTDTKYSVQIKAPKYKGIYNSGYYYADIKNVTYVDKTEEYADLFGLDENFKAQGTTDATVDLADAIKGLGAKIAEDCTTASGTIKGDGTLSLVAVLDFDEEVLGFNVSDIYFGQYSCDNLVFSLEYMNGAFGVKITGTIGNGKELHIPVDNVDISDVASYTLHYYEKSATTNTQIAVVNGEDATSTYQTLVSGSNPADYIYAPLNIVTKFPSVTTVKKVLLKFIGGGSKDMFISGLKKVEFTRETVTYNMANGNLAGIVTPLHDGEITTSKVDFTSSGLDGKVDVLTYNYEGDDIVAPHVAGVIIDLGGIKVSEYKTIRIIYQSFVTQSNAGGAAIFLDSTNADSRYGGQQTVDLKALAESKGVTVFSTVELTNQGWNDAGVPRTASYKLYVAEIVLELAD